LQTIEHDLQQRTLISKDPSVNEFITKLKETLTKNQCDYETSRIYLYATAGMRNPNLEKEKFIFDNFSFYIGNPKLIAQCIDGSKEGIFDFLTGLYMVRHSILQHNHKTLVIDLGGMSTQIA